MLMKEVIMILEFNTAIERASSNFRRGLSSIKINGLGDVVMVRVRQPSREEFIKRQNLDLE